jgi:hypothetical protein
MLGGRSPATTAARAASRRAVFRRPATAGSGIATGPRPAAATRAVSGIALSRLAWRNPDSRLTRLTLAAGSPEVGAIRPRRFAPTRADRRRSDTVVPRIYQYPGGN